MLLTGGCQLEGWKKEKLISTSFLPVWNLPGGNSHLTAFWTCDFLQIDHLKGWSSGNSRTESLISRCQRKNPSRLNLNCEDGDKKKQIFRLIKEIRTLAIQGAQIMTNVNFAQLGSPFLWNSIPVAMSDPMSKAIRRTENKTLVPKSMKCFLLWLMA